MPPRRWRKAVDLAKADRLFKDAMETTAQSGDAELATELLSYFITAGESERGDDFASHLLCNKAATPFYYRGTFSGHL